MDIIEDARALVTPQEVADALNECKGTSEHPWLTGYVLVGKARLGIDLDASDRLASRALDMDEAAGRAHNENHSAFMVAGGIGVRHIDGRGWVPAEEG